MNQLAGARIGLLTSWASRANGGVFEAVVAQARLIEQLGGTPVIFALEDGDAAQDRPRFAGAEVHLCRPVGPSQIGYAPDLVDQLLGADLACLHLHGIWMYPSLAGARWAARSGRPYFVSPHGMLDPWITARGRWKKAIARLGYERESWRRATALHGLTQREAVDIERETGRKDTAVIPNAGPDVATQASGPRSQDVLYIGRIHPKKNLLALVQAWRAARLPADARLTIAGWGDPADVAALESEIAQCGGSVRFLGPVFGDQKAELLAGARFVVLPSHSEGLPMAILEAWAGGIPTLMTDQCNLDEGFSQGAAVRCAYDAEEIAAGLERITHMEEREWMEMSAAALALAGGQFSSASVAARWGEVYAAAISDARQEQAA